MKLKMPDAGTVLPYLRANAVPSWDEAADAHHAAYDAETAAEAWESRASSFAARTGGRDASLDAEAATCRATAARLRAHSDDLDARRIACSAHAQRTHDAGGSTEYFVRTLSPMRNRHRHRSAVVPRRPSPVSASVAAASRRSRTCGGGRPASRPARRSAASTDDPSSTGDQLQPTRTARRRPRTHRVGVSA